MVEQRRSKRFEVKLPLKLVRNGIRPLSGIGETRNLSSGGVLFFTDTMIDIGEPIEYVITLRPEAGISVNLHCLGKVIRLEVPIADWQDPTRPFQVAATMERYEFIRPKS